MILRVRGVLSGSTFFSVVGRTDTSLYRRTRRGAEDRNRLIEVQTRIDVGGSSTAYETGDKHVYFTYDCMGRRVRKRVETYNGSSWPETSDELFVYDGWNVVMVLNANASNAITRKYTWGPDLSQSIVSAADRFCLRPTQPLVHLWSWHESETGPLVAGHRNTRDGRSGSRRGGGCVR